MPAFSMLFGLSGLPFWFSLFPFTVPLVLVWAAQTGGWSWLAVPLLVFGLVPLLDGLLGPAPAGAPAPRGLNIWLLMAWVPIQLLMLIWGAATAASLSGYGLLGLALGAGICTGATGITLAHELMHRRSRLDKSLSLILLLSVSYMHFYIEHLRGHHRRVATPGDPATALLGESFYRFYPRALKGCWTTAWQLEAGRLQRRSLPFWHNQMIWFSLLPVALATALGLAWGWPAALFFAVQSIVAFSLLESVNYVEHYGLARREIRAGVYEPVQMAHSWNADQLLTGSLMFMLQRHSDHHAHPARPWHQLHHAPESPQLPAGYAAMILLALLPPLWHRVMDPRARQVLAAGTDIRPGSQEPNSKIQYTEISQIQLIVNS
ncbi:MAG TPA: alkane 1-monooxygenase [Candidatus Obscuribacterales bacterium]